MKQTTQKDQTEKTEKTENKTPVTPVTPEERELLRREAARRKLFYFIRYRFENYKTNWHLRLLADKLDDVIAGKTKRLMVFMPPRHGKSEIISVNFPAFAMGKDKDKNIITASYSSDLSSVFGRQVRDIMRSPEYERLFDTRLAEDSSAKAQWSTNGRGNYNAVGVGGSATGKGADIFIIDDPVKNRMEAESTTVSDAIWSWYRSTARTRLSPDGAIILVMTRWNDMDLAGRLLAQDPDRWEVINLPAIAMEDDKYRKKGEVLWPGHFTMKHIEEARNEVGAYEFASLYQQTPITPENAVFKPDMFKYISMDEVLKKQTSCYVTIDSALSKKKESDWTGITINWVDTDNHWHVKSYREKMDSTELFDLIFNLHQNFHPEAIGIEDTVFVQAVEPFLTIEMAKRNIYPNVVKLKHGGLSKEIRIRGLQPRYERGHVFHIQGMCAELEQELVKFPASASDDVMDSLAYQVQIALAPYEGEQNEDEEATNEWDMSDDMLFDDIGG